MFRKLADRLIDNVENAIIQEATRAIMPHIQDAARELVDSVINNAPSVRSTGGATSMCLTKVRLDFKDFHAEDADSDIQTFLLELLQLQYEGKGDFEKAKVSDRVQLNIERKTVSKLSNIKINGMSISNYQKSLNAATLRYRVSVGFDVDGVRNEKLYEIEYTLQLRDEYGAKKFLECENCGAPLEEMSGECKFCGMKTIRDTISSWVVTGFEEK